MIFYDLIPSWIRTSRTRGVSHLGETLVSLSAALALSACGTQINTLKNAARISSGALGTPPALTSLTIDDASPTNHSPLSISAGIVVGSVDQYCFLENDTDAAHCIWHSGALPATYVDGAADGAFALTAFLKNTFGVSEPIVSNTITLDRTAPTLATVTVGNSNPTNDPVFTLSYGAISNLPYADYCLLENATSSAGCAWVPGSVPSSYTVSAANGSKAISVWLRDAAGNVSPRMTTAAIDYDSSVPTVTIASPAAGTPANLSNFASFTVSGSCSVNGATVTISGAASTSTSCSGGGWSANLDLTSVAEGAFVVNADLTNAAGTPAAQASRSFTKDTVAPTLAITSPAAGSSITAANAASFGVSGTCSENGRTIAVSAAAGAVTASPTCSGGAWSATLDLSSVADGAIAVKANLSDVTGNAAAEASIAYVKDTGAPTVAITLPAAGASVNAANVSAFNVSGTCSENGRTVAVSAASGAVIASPTCSSGAWSATLDLSAASDGTVVVKANLSDAAGNAATEASIAYVKDTGVPAVAITLPAASSFVNAANASAFTVSGTCSEDGRTVTLSGAGSTTTTCASGAWSKTLDLSSVADGTITLYADHADSGGNAATEASIAYVKDTGAPTVAITLPAAGAFVTSANMAAFTVSGTCSEDGRTVTLSGAASATTTCASGTWSKALDLSAAAEGAVTIKANLSDAAGNAATEASIAYVKDTGAPTVAIALPTAGASVNIANVSAFAVSGTCSEDGRAVSVSAASGAVTASPTCSGGTWSATLDLSSVADGAITVKANLSDAAGNAATEASIAYVKDTGAPTLSIGLPAAGASVNAANVSAFNVSGACSEDGRTVTISGSVAATTTCASGAWSVNLDLSSVADGAISVKADLSDAAGNAAPQASITYVKDATAPTLASMTITNSDPTNSTTYGLGYGAQSGAFTDYCVLENSTNFPDCASAWVSSASLPANFTVSTAENSKSLTIWLRDAAGNVSTAVTSANSVTLDTTPPAVALTSFTGGQAFVGGTTEAVTWTASDAHLASNPISISYSTDSGATWNAIASGLANSGSYAWSLPSVDSGTIRVRVSASDSAGNSESAASTADVAIDTTAPVFVAAKMTVNGGTSPTLSYYVPVEFEAKDTAAKVTQYCLKYNSTTTPAAGDSCWVSISPTDDFVAAVDFRLGFSGGAYSVYAWAKNAAGLISSLTNAGAGTGAQDTASVMFTPIPPPTLTGVTASASDGSVDLTVSSGATVYVKWSASTTGTFPASPISIYYTTDDTNYTSVAANLPNAQGAGCTISGSETGCYAWTGGSPTSSYYRLRVGAVDTNARQSYQSSAPLNVGTSLRILAGATDPGTGGSAEAAIFASERMASSEVDPQSFVVTTAGILYFSDVSRGVLKVDPSNGVQQLLLPKVSGTATDGAVPGATVRYAHHLALDPSNRLLIFDYDRIRRYDPATNAVTTIIGGGASTAATVAPLSLKITAPWAGQPIAFAAAADGKIYFQSENYSYAAIGAGYVLRTYDPVTDLVTSRSFSGIGNSYDPTQDISLCQAFGMAVALDPVTGELQQIVLKMIQTASSYAGCTAPSDHFPGTVVSPANGLPSGPHFNLDYSQIFTYGAKGKLLTIDRPTAKVMSYDPATHSFTTLLGSGAKDGICADGTDALSCAIDVSDAFLDANGKLYYSERGRIRTLDQDGKVRTVMGSGFSAGDGGPATSARFGSVTEVKLWNDGAHDRVVVGDSAEYRIREFEIGGNVQTIAGTGANAKPDTSSPAASQAIYLHTGGEIAKIRFAVDESLGTVYCSYRNDRRISKIDRSTGKWVDLVGTGGSTYWDDPAADGKTGSQVLLNGYLPQIVDSDGTRLYSFHGKYLSSSMLKTYAVADGTQGALVGVQGSYGPLPADGTPGTSATIRSLRSGVWDAYASRFAFIIDDDDSQAQQLRSIAPGGNLGTVASLPNVPASLTYRHDATHELVYYCGRDDRKLHKFDVSTSTDTTLTWPISKLQCAGKGLVYSATRNSIIFPFTQDGIAGVAEYPSP